METETTKGNEPTVMKSIVKGTLNAVYNGESLKQYILCLVRRTVTNAQIDEAIDKFHLENELDNACYIYDDIDTKISSFESKVKSILDMVSLRSMTKPVSLMIISRKLQVH